MKQHSSVLNIVVMMAVCLLMLSSVFSQSAVVQAAGTITGNVFRDFNANGIDDGANEIGFAGVTVTAYDAAGAMQGTATTAANGNYTLNATGTGPYRIEFTTLPSGYFPGPQGTGSGTTVQFAPNGNSSNVNLGINHPEDYSQANPRVVTAILQNGLYTGQTTPSIVSLPYTANGLPVMYGGTQPNPVQEAQIQETGAIWGFAYQRDQQRLFSTAMLRRHADFGPQGPGGIYIFDFSTPATPLVDSFSLQGITPTNGGAVIDLGTVTRTGGTDYTLSSDPATPNIDLDAFAKVGSISFGDAELSDVNTLWIVNLNQRALIRLDISGNVFPISSSAAQYPLASLPGYPVCTGGEFRPWALKFHHGVGYLGGVCDASISQNAANLVAHVLSFDPATIAAGFTPAIAIPLTYTREGAQANSFNGITDPATWRPWIASWSQKTVSGPSYAQPLLSDIEISEDGALILGFTDRFGIQAGYNDYTPEAGSTSLFNAFSAGDIIHVCRVGTNYIMEGQVTCPDNDTGAVPPDNLGGGNGNYGALSNDGPSGTGEFYPYDYYDGLNATGNTQANHLEVTTGGLLLLPGTQQVATTTFDPYLDTTNGNVGIYAQGVHWYSTLNGSRSRTYMVQNDTTGRFGKAGGLGDLELLLDPAPLEIGNRVWADANNNGIQDAGESGIDGVAVQLWADTNGDSTVDSQVGNTTTANGGQYYFGGINNTNLNAGQALQPDTAYEIRVGTTQPLLGSLSLSPTNADVSTNGDARDSDATLNGGTAVVAFTTGGAGANDHSYDIGFAPLLVCAPASNDLGGTIFHDFNADGIDNGANEPAYNSPEQITVTAYDNSNVAIATTTVRPDGTYLFPDLFATVSAVRLEFTGLPAWLQPSAHGSTPGSAVSVQRHQAGTCSADFAVNAPADYCQNNPDLCTNTYVNGDTNTIAPTMAMFRFNYNDTGISPAPNSIATKAAIGSTWGLAYSRQSSTLYAAAFLRRHVGLGPNGLGAIYQILNANSATPGTPSLFFDLATVPGINLGTIGSNAARGLGSPIVVSNDPTAFDSVGKIGLGDIDISDDGSTLYTINLNERTLIHIPTTSPSSANIIVYPIPTTNCVGGETRPFGIKYYRGMVYLGVVCDGSSSDRTNLTASVYKFDPVSTAFSQVFQVPLTYTKGSASIGCISSTIATQWHAWVSTMGSETSCTYPTYAYPQPMLTDIEFDVDGSLILGFTDRWGYQLGNMNNSPTGAYPVSAVTGGDILRAYPSGSTFIAESNGIAGVRTGSGVGNNQGVGGGEFYDEGLRLGVHQEVAQGGLALHTGRGHIVTTAMDPNDFIYSGGVQYYNNSNGSIDHSYTLYTSSGTASEFGKANGLGDLELLCDSAPLEIGNYVWFDADNDGIQDPVEPPIPGVTVTLHDSAGTQVASTTTDANGEYYFNNANVPGGVVPTTDYSIRIDTSQVPLLGLMPTLLDYNGNTGNGDLHDSDGDTAINPGVVTAPLTTGAPGHNDHSFDFGFTTPTFSLGNRVWFDTDNDGVLDAGEVGINGVDISLFLDADANGVPDTLATPLAASSSAAGGFYRFDNLAANTYVVRINPLNFAVGGPLAGYTSSTLSDPTPNNDQDSDDNGIDDPAPSTNGIFSGPIMLGPGATEPTGETDLSPTGQGGTDNQANMTVDFGFYRLTIGNQLWVDINNNGQLESGESGAALAGVRVELYDGATLVAVTTTDAAGAYLFDRQTNSTGVPTGPGLAPSATYTVRIPASAFAPGEPLAPFFSSTGATSGTDSTDNGVDNPPYPLNGIRSATFSLQAGVASGGAVVSNAEGTTTNLTLDFGFSTLSLGDRVFIDNNNNGLFDGTDSGLVGVTVNLYFDSDNNGLPDGAAIATQATIADGYYLFTGLDENTYIVEVVPPAGYISSTGANGDTTGLYEPAPDPDTTTTDGDDNGTTASTVIRSASVTLQVGNAPTGEPATPGFSDPATDANSNLTVDFGLFRPLSLGNLVWEDANNNGIVDSGESGIDGVTVALYTVGQTPDVDPPVATTTTAGGGLYHFTNLTPGDYLVFLPPSNFATGAALEHMASSTGTNGSASGPYEAAPDPNTDTDNDDNGSTSGTGVVSLPITLSLNGEPAAGVDGDDSYSNQTVDFGFFEPASLGDFVWYDTTANGVQDGGETGVPGVLVTLYDAVTNAVVVTTTTDASGAYLFNQLIPGSYYVIFANLPPGYAVVTPDLGGDDARDSDAAVFTGQTGTYPLVAGQHEPTVDAGIAPNNTLQLGNLLWADYNDNGLVDPGEPGLAGVVVELLDGTATTVLASTSTDANGHYYFSNLTPGDYVVRIPSSEFGVGAVLENWSSSSAGGASEPAPDPDTDRDNDDNGTHNSGVVVSLPVTLTLLGEPDTAVDGDAANGNLTVDFGLVPQLASLGDVVWYDSTRNNIQDVGEVGVPGVRVHLRDSSGNSIATTTTDANGNYLFSNLVPGVYSVMFEISTLSPDYRLVSQDIGGDDTVDSDTNGLTGATIQTTLTAGENDLTWDAGVYQLSSIGDYVWLDRDGDGVQDAGENGVAGVTVNLLDSSGAVLATTSTDGGGHYIFANLEPDTYQLAFVPPPGYALTSQDSPSGSDLTDSDAHPTTGRTATTTLDPGEHDPSWDAGLRGAMSLGNLVWEDINNNGVVDGGEAGIAGVTVQLYADSNADGLPDGAALATMSTDAAGIYRFSHLLPGVYMVELTPPTGYTSSTGTNGSAIGPYEAAPDPDDDRDNDDNGTLTGAVIRSGPVELLPNHEPVTDGDSDANSNLTVDFGLFLPARLGSTVWNDQNHDGVHQSSEPGVPNILVTLYDSHGTSVATQQTDTNGQYGFCCLAPGSYVVAFSNLPRGWQFTVQAQGSDPRQDSDVDPASGRTPLVRLQPGEDNPTVFAGLWNSNGTTAVTLASFSARWQGAQVVVVWRTSRELDTYGFILLRSADGQRAHALPVTAHIIFAHGRGSDGTTYTWIDRVGTATIDYRYWLVEVDASNAQHEVGMTVAEAAGHTSSGSVLFVPVAQR